MKSKNLLGILCLFGIFCVVSSFKQPSISTTNSRQNRRSEVYRHKILLDPLGKYLLEYEISWPTSQVTFNVTVETRGYVGFGLSRKGKMSGADIVIGGVENNGNSYFSDRHAIKNQLPEIDQSQDWTMNSAWERGNTTFLSFSRAFDTCDEDQDLPITDDLLAVIWSYGEADDDLQYHFQNRGSYNLYLRDPDYIPEASRTLDGLGVDLAKLPSDIKAHTISVNMTLLPQDTLYWCTYHKMPTTTKHHIVGYTTKFPTQEDRKVVHHIVVYRCFTPPGFTQDEFFSEAAASEGSACYNPLFPNTHPSAYCNEVVHLWAVGGRPFMFPPHVGIPISEQGSEYFMMQVHYDNPSMEPGKLISTGLEIYYTANLRENDLGGMGIGDISEGATSIIIPPNSQNHVVLGQCAGKCTEKMLPVEGISILGVILHTHQAGKGMRLLHFRGEKELPWISADDNYSFNQQQNRIFKEERRVLPGDTVTIRCVYDTTSKNGSTTVGGFSTRKEMCLAVIWFYNRLPGHGDCRGETKSQEYKNLIGIQNATLNEEGAEIVIREPENLSGMLVEDYANNYINWDIRTREQLQDHHLYQPFTSVCVNSIPIGMADQGPNLFPQPVFDMTDGEQDSALPRGIPRYTRPQTCGRQVKRGNG